MKGREYLQIEILANSGRKSAGAAQTVETEP